MEPLSKLLAKAAERSQLWITTHSAKLAELVASETRTNVVHLAKHGGETVSATRHDTVEPRVLTTGGARGRSLEAGAGRLDMTHLRSEAEGGSVPAQAVVGLCYLHGIKVSRDHAEAFRWLTLAAAEGAPRAVLNLGLMYENRWACDADICKAADLYEQAVDGDEWLALIHLARIYGNGSLGRTDTATALALYQRAVASADQIAPCPEVEEAEAFIRLHEEGAS